MRLAVTAYLVRHLAGAHSGCPCGEGHCLAAPESLRCQAGAFHQSLKLQLGDGRVQPTRAEAAVRPGDHIFAPDDRRVVADTLRDKLRVLDRIGVVADDARDEDLALWQLDVLPETPFVRVTRVRCLYRVGLDLHVQHQVDDILQWYVRVVRPLVCAPADVHPYPAGR